VNFLKIHNKFNNIKTVYFDYDGTLHDSIKIYAPAFRKAYDYLVELKKAPVQEHSDEEIAKWLGYTNHEMWNIFMNDLDVSTRKQADNIVKNEIKDQMRQGRARLFDNIIEVLQHLKNKGHKLVFLSNCGVEYMEGAKKFFKLDDYFDDMVCSGMYGYKPKHEILNLIKNSYPMDQVMVGDRFHDIRSAIYNNIESIFCEYGYGDAEEGKDASASVKKPIEILNYLG